MTTAASNKSLNIVGVFKYRTVLTVCERKSFIIVVKTESRIMRYFVYRRISLELEMIQYELQ